MSAANHYSGSDSAVSGGVAEMVSYLAAATSLAIIGLGVLQAFAPDIAAPFTGLSSGPAASVLAIQWCALGALLAIGGLFAIRALVLFSADFLLISGASGAAVMMLGQPEMLPLAVHGAIMLVGLLNGGFARLTRNAERENESRDAHEHAIRNVPVPGTREMNG